MDDNKAKALAAALQQIEKQFGKGSIMKMGDAEIDEGIQVVSTGSLGLGGALGVGGLLLALVVAVVKLVVGVLIIALFENSMARLRFCATSRVTWAGFGFAFLAFVSLLVA